MPAATFNMIHTDENIDNVATTWRAWAVCLTAALFFFYEFIQMNMLSSLNQDLMAAFSVGAPQLGILSSIYFAANVIFILPAGQLLDRFSTRNIILVTLSLCIAGTYAFSLTNSLWIAGLFRFITGIGSAFCFLSSIRLASRWFPARRMALMSGLIVTLAMLGGWVAQVPFSWVVGQIGWRGAVRVDVVLGLVILLLIACVVRDRPDGRKDVCTQKQDLQSLGYWQSLKKAYMNRQNWFAGLYTCLMNLPLFLLGAIWGSLFLEQIHGFTRNEATSITGMIFLGTMIGSPLAGFISDKLGLRKLPMKIGALVSLGLVLTLVFAPHLSYAMLLVIFFFFGLISSTQVISYPLIAESNPTHITAMSVSVVSFTTLFGGGFIGIPLFGYILNWHWNGLVSQGVAVYSVSNYHVAMLMMPVALIFAFLITHGLKETNCKRV
jgi:MFS family permease